MFAVCDTGFASTSITPGRRSNVVSATDFEDAHWTPEISRTTVGAVLIGSASLRSFVRDAWSPEVSALLILRASRQYDQSPARVRTGAEGAPRGTLRRGPLRSVRRPCLVPS